MDNRYVTIILCEKTPTVTMIATLLDRTLLPNLLKSQPMLGENEPIQVKHTIGAYADISAEKDASSFLTSHSSEEEAEKNSMLMYQIPKSLLVMHDETYD